MCFPVGYAAVFIVPVLSCRPKEYKTNDGQCCPTCNEGRVVQRDCTAYSGTQCRSCDLGTFMNQPNGLYNCFPCTSCDTGHGLFVKQKCTATTDTVCDVLNGYHCKGFTHSNRCSLAEKHSQCAAGQRIKEPGTSRSDTVCEDCRPGFFSKDGVNCTLLIINVLMESLIYLGLGLCHIISSAIVPVLYYILCVAIATLCVCFLVFMTRSQNHACLNVRAVFQ
uniref:TNFR-Cys domain-containing protein n=1 Tax=Oreochromis aureus TaxID=47969 RepID=A0A668RQA9_OREAU